MLRAAASVALALLAAACGREQEAGSPPPAEAARPPAAGPAPAPSAGAVGPGLYVGRWAARPDLCAAGAWTFSADRLSTAGEVACSFRRVERTASGWEVAASCTSQGPAQDAQLTLTLTDPAPPEAMTVAGGPFQSITLRRCR